MAGWDYVAFHESAARNGLAGVAVPAGEDTHKYSGDDLYVKGAGVVSMVQIITAAVANYDEGRFHRTLDPNWVHTRMFFRDQTGAIEDPMFLAYPFNAGDVLRAEADNGNNAQVESVQLALIYSGTPNLRTVPTGIPAGARWVQGAGGTAAVANTWTTSAMTWSETFNLGQTYTILGMIGYSATGYAARLKYKGSAPSRGWSPGIPLGDTNILVKAVYGNFGQFMGDQPPDMQVLCSGTDAAQYVDILVI